MPRELRLKARDEVIDALLRLGARPLWGTTLPDKHRADVLTLYNIAGRVVIVHVMFGGASTDSQLRPKGVDSRELVGVDVYVPVCDRNRIDETVAAIEAWKEGALHRQCDVTVERLGKDTERLRAALR